ncbi:MAG: SseB family protein [Rhodospirillales bacterium]|nr:SseB family protein [Rhodospirillales bacterium]
MPDQPERPPLSPSPSPLEQALIAMDQRRLSPNEFYQRLLATEVFVPTVLDDSQGEEEDEYVTDAPENFSLIVMDVDDQRAVPMFDDFERLQKWAGESGSDVGYIGIGADVLLSIMDPDFSVAFFAGDEGFYLFDPETLENLKDPQVEMIEETPEDLAADLPMDPSDDPIMIDVPDTVPDGLVEALASVLQSHDGAVAEARLLTLSGAASEDGSDNTARLTVGMTLRENSDELFNDVARDITRATTSLLQPDENIHFLNLTGTELGDSLQESLPPFFAWPDGTIH